MTQLDSPLCSPQVGFDVGVIQFHRVRAVIYRFFEFPKLQCWTEVK